MWKQTPDLSYSDGDALTLDNFIRRLTEHVSGLGVPGGNVCMRFEGVQVTKFARAARHIFFSDPDEIIRPELLNNFSLKRKYGIFLQDFYNFKFPL